MTKERIPISGDLKSKVKQLMEYAGWQEGRKVDISIAEKYYADHGVPMMKTTQRFYRKYFGISEYGKLYAKYEYQDEIECFPDVFALIERELRQCKFDSAAMKTVGALDGKP